MPSSSCLRTISATDAARHAAWAASFLLPPIARARFKAMRSAGRDRRPACVVRILSVLRRNVFILSRLKYAGGQRKTLVLVGAGFKPALPAHRRVARYCLG